MAGGLSLAGALDLGALAGALDDVRRRHEVLRTVFRERAGHPVQVVLPAGSVRTALPLVDLSGLPSARGAGAGPGSRTAARGRVFAAALGRPFDLARGPLVRALAVRESADEHALLVLQHHIVSDGWSTALLVRDLGACYAARLGRSDRQAAADLPELPIQYGDYAGWLERTLDDASLVAERAYWQERLAGAPALELPTDRPRPAARRGRGGLVRSGLPASVVAALDRTGEAAGTTRYMTLLAAYQVLLGRLSGQRDLTVGSPVAHRTRPELEELIGFFVNTLVLRADLGEDCGAEPSFGTVLERTRGTVLGALAHQDLPFERLVDELAPDRALGHSPLFQAMFVLQSAPAAPALDLPGLRLAPLAMERSAARWDLSLAAEEAPDGGGMVLALEYDADLFDRTTAHRLLGQLGVLLEAALARPETAIDALPLLTAPERQQLLEWNAAAVGPGVAPSPRPLHERFLAHARSTPDRVAAAIGERALTYGALQRRAARLAGRLRRAGVGPEDLVGLCAERSLELVVGILAILEAGGAYLPLDPGVPAGRLELILEDAGPAAVLVQEGLEEVLPIPVRPARDGALEIVTLRLGDEEGAAATHGEPPVPAPIMSPVDPDHLAYVIYTSGSTGRPKGTLISHRAMARLFDATAPWFGFGRDGVWTLFHSYAFDFSVWELWGPLAHGGRLEIVPYWVSRSPRDVLDLLRDRRVTVLSQTPSAFKQLVAAETEASPADAAAVRAPVLDRVVFGGEALEPAALAPWIERHGTARPALVNMYGITETTVHVTYRPVRAGDLSGRAGSPVGVPIPDLRVHLLDPRMGPVPLGVPGEIHVGGPGLARGYLGRPGLTAERFVPDPFAGAAGERLYRSGDLARRLPDGGLDFLGRIDHQVKIRGFRIELGEIEAVLVRHPAVAQAAVVARAGRGGGGGDTILAAYLVPAAGRALHLAALRAHAAEVLPEYMVPSSWHRLEALPLTANGKLDRRALPEPEATPVRGGEGFVAPRGAIERAIAEVYAEVLGIDRVGADDGFFALGGHSLLATQVVSRLGRVLGAEPSLRELFEAPRVRDLAAVLERHLERAAEVAGTLDREVSDPESAEAAAGVPMAADGVARPLSAAQRRIWFLDRLRPGTSLYNVPGRLALDGALRPAALAAALTGIVERHQVLRVRVAESDAGPFQGPAQVVGEPRPVPLPVVDLSGLAAAAAAPEAERRAADLVRRPFDLATGPMLHATLLRMAPRGHQLVLVLHHLVADGWSMGIFVREMGELYGAATAGRRPALEPLALQFPDYALAEARRLATGVLEEQLAAWCETLAGLEPLELPTDRPRTTVRTGRAGTAKALLGAELTAVLDDLARTSEASRFMVALAVLQALLGSTAGKDDLAVGCPVANRRRLESEALIGCLVNTLVLRGDLSGAPTVREHLARVRRTALTAFDRQDVPFERLVEELARRAPAAGGRPDGEVDRAPLFEVFLGHQNAPHELPELPDLAIEALPVAPVGAKFDLGFELVAGADGLELHASYDRDLFDHTTVARWLARFRGLAAAFAEHPEAPLAALSPVPAAERHQVVVEWSIAPASGPRVAGRRERRPDDRSATLHGLVRARAARTPDAVALDACGAQVTYGEMEHRALVLAARLRAETVAAATPEPIVGIFLERSLEAVVAILGALEAGAAYLPLDPSSPDARLVHVLRDATPVAVVADRAAAARVEELLDGAGCRAAVVCHDEPVPRPAAGQEPADPSALAYVIYTSGSTGRPKGVGVGHGAAVDHVRTVIEAYDLDPDDQKVLLGSMSFDLSVEEIFSTLAVGARLLIWGPEPFDVPGFGHFLATRRLTRVNLTTAAWAEWARQAPATAERTLETEHLAIVVVGGEAMPADAAERFDALVPPGTRVLNAYGPTEAIVTSTLHPVGARPGRGWGQVPIGRALGDDRAIVVDAALRPVPVGVPGELLLVGAGLARGYLGRPALTAERFVPDRFEGAARCSGRSGLPDRRPRALAARRQPGVPRAQRPPGQDPRLPHRARRDRGRPVPRARGRRGGGGGARRPRRGALPRRVPGGGRRRGARPGRDPPPLRRRFAGLHGAGGVGGAAGAAALDDGQGRSRRPARARLRGTRERVGGVRGATHGDRGAGRRGLRGDSRRRAGRGPRLVLRARRPLAQGDAPGLAAPHGARPGGAAAAALRAADGGGAGRGARPGRPRGRGRDRRPAAAGRDRGAAGVVLPGAALGPRPPAAGHVRVQHPPDPPAARAAPRRRPGTGLERPGRSPRDPADRLRRDRDRPGPAGTPGAAPRAAADRPAGPAGGAALRGRSRAGGARGPRALRPGAGAVAADDPGLPGAGRAHAGHRDPPRGRRRLVGGGAGARDGDALRHVRRRRRTGGGAAAPLPIQFGDYAAWERQRLAGERLEGLIRAWSERLDGLRPLALPTDRPRPAERVGRGAMVRRSLPATLRGRLDGLARARGVTEFMVLVAAFQALLARLCGDDDVAVGTPIANRNRSELEPLIGFFVNTLVLRGDLSGDPTFADLLERTREVTLDAYGHQELPFDRLVEELAPERDPSRTPVFQVMVTFQSAGGAMGGEGLTALGGVEVTPVPLDTRVAKFDLTAAFAAVEEGIELAFEYDAALFDRQTIERLAERFEGLLERAATAPETRLGALPLLTAAEREQVLGAWRGPVTDYPRETTVTALFREQAAARPDAVALDFRSALDTAPGRGARSGAASR